MRKSSTVKFTQNNKTFCGVISKMAGKNVEVTVDKTVMVVCKENVKKITKKELTSLQNCVEHVITERPQTVEVKVEVKKEKKITKKMKCQAIYEEMMFISPKFRRKLVLERFLEEVGLSLKGGSTYYQNFKSQLKGWEIN